MQVRILHPASSSSKTRNQFLLIVKFKTPVFLGSNKSLGLFVLRFIRA